MLIISAACAVFLDICHLLALLFLYVVLESAMEFEKQRKKVEFSLINFHCFASNEFSCVLFSFFCSFCVFSVQDFSFFQFSFLKCENSTVSSAEETCKWEKENMEEAKSQFSNDF